MVVYTGPEGAPFWSLVSIEVAVKVVPDGYEYEPRTQDVGLWSLRTVCATDAEAKRLFDGYYALDKEPTAKHGLYDRWVEADALRRALGTTEARPASASPIIVEAFKAEIIRDPAEQLRLLDNIHEFASLDFEWLMYGDHEPVGLAVSTADRNWYLPNIASDYRAPEGHGTALREAVARFVPAKPSVWHNAKADLKTQHPGDLLPLVGAPIDDTLVMAFNAGHTDLKLKHIIPVVFPDRLPMDYPMTACPSCRGRGVVVDDDIEDDCEDCGGAGKTGIEELPVELAARYAAAGDTRNTFDLYHALKGELAAREQWGVYETIERPIVPLVADMERGGSPVDPAALQLLRDNLVLREEELRQRVLREGFDLADDEQTKAYIKSKTGYNPGSLSKWTLAKYQGAWMDDVLEYRQVRHRRRAFADKHLARWEKAGRPLVLWAYSNFNQAGGTLANDPRGFKSAPRSFRFSSSGDFGNWQNQPRSMRAMFPAPEGYVYWSLDYSGLELHIGAAVSRDPLMLKTLTTVCTVSPDPDSCPHEPKCGDLHDALRHKVKELSGRDIGRVPAKAANFEQMYGGQADKLVQILAVQRAFIDYETAKLLVMTHREAFAGYHAYSDYVVETARSNGGYAETLFGHRRYEPTDLFGDDPERRGWAQRALVNMTIQGTAADILKLAMKYAVPVLQHYGAHLALQVHDELCGWVPADKAEKFIETMKALMSSIPVPGLRLKVSGGTGANWGEAH